MTKLGAYTRGPYKRQVRLNKTCSWCRQLLPIENFDVTNKLRNYRRSACRDCYQAYNKEWRNANAEQLSEKKKTWRHANPDRAFASRLRRYSLTPGEWYRLFEAQGCKCACCGTSEPGTVWTIDHDHALHPGKGTQRRPIPRSALRGITCVPCNLMLGHAKDSPTTLRAGAAYLERPR